MSVITLYKNGIVIYGRAASSKDAWLRRLPRFLRKYCTIRYDWVTETFIREKHDPPLRSQTIRKMITHPTFGRTQRAEFMMDASHPVRRCQLLTDIDWL